MGVLQIVQFVPVDRYGYGRAGAPVAIPVDWNELNDLQDAHPFDIGDVEMLWERASKLKGWGFAAQALPDL